MNKRQKEIQQTFLNNEKAVLKKLEENYKDALDEINSKIELLMARQDADMQHVIYQVQYQKALKTQVQSILEALQTNEFETVSEYLTKSYEEGFIGTMYDLQGQGIPLIFPIDQEQVVAAVQQETKLSEDLYTAMGKDITELRKKISSEISRGLSTGMLYGEISRNIASWARIPKNNAMRIARTEAHRIQIKAAYDAQVKAKDKGADVVKQWDATLDGKTRENHRKLDGQIRELDEPFEIGRHKAMYPGGFGRPDEDINCRCALLQRARWALGNSYTKWSEDAEIEYSDDGTAQLAIIEAKNYEDFQKKYKQASERVREDAQKMKAKAMTEQEYLVSKGVGSPVGEYQDDKIIGHTKVLNSKATKKDYQRTSEEYWQKREAARKEYREKVLAGELRDKTEIEKTFDIAQGHDDLPSVQAARRMLAKRGIDWKTGKAIKPEQEQAQKVQKAFKPAESIAEAEAFIKKYVDDSLWAATGVSYSGIKVEAANAVNEALDNLYSKFKLEKLGGVYAAKGNTTLGKAITDATAGYSHARRSLLLNTSAMKDLKSVEKTKADELRYIAMYKNDTKSVVFATTAAEEIMKVSLVSGRATVPDTVADVINHEMGHYIHRTIAKFENYGNIKSNMAKYAEKVSGYATTNEAEYIAESFASYMKGENIIDSELRKAFDLLKKEE